MLLLTKTSAKILILSVMRGNRLSCRPLYRRVRRCTFDLIVKDMRTGLTQSNLWTMHIASSLWVIPLSNLRGNSHRTLGLLNWRNNYLLLLLASKDFFFKTCHHWVEVVFTYLGVVSISRFLFPGSSDLSLLTIYLWAWRWHYVWQT